MAQDEWMVSTHSMCNMDHVTTAASARDQVRHLEGELANHWKNVSILNHQITLEQRVPRCTLSEP